jgi:hypothetical protein
MNQLSQAVEALGDDADLEGPVEGVLGFEHRYLPALRSRCDFLMIILWGC